MELTREEKIIMANSNFAIHKCEFPEIDEVDRELLIKLHLDEITEKEYGLAVLKNRLEKGKLSKEEYEELVQIITTTLFKS